MSFHPKNYRTIYDFCTSTKVQAFRHGQQSNRPFCTLSGKRCLNLFRKNAKLNGISADEFEHLLEVSDAMYDYEMEHALITWLEDIYFENPHLLPDKLSQHFDDLFLRTVYS